MIAAITPSSESSAQSCSKRRGRQAAPRDAQVERTGRRHGDNPGEVARTRRTGRVRSRCQEKSQRTGSERSNQREITPIGARSRRRRRSPATKARAHTNTNREPPRGGSNRLAPAHTHAVARPAQQSTSEHTAPPASRRRERTPRAASEDRARSHKRLVLFVIAARRRS